MMLEATIKNPDSLPEKIPVYMPDEEVAKFLVFQEHYEVFAILVEKKVFEQKNCAIILNFDSKGALATINREDVLYSRRHTDVLGPIPG